MKKMLLFCGGLLLMLSACKNMKTDTTDELEAEEDSTGIVQDDMEDMDELISEEPMPVAAEELFDDFFFNFASNRKLQMERIHFPIILKAGAKTDTIERREWQMEHFFMHNDEYTLIFDSERQMEQVKDTSINKATVEKIFLDQGFVWQYHFARTNGRWTLNAINKQTLSLNSNASFLSFYRRFATDSVFQHHSLSDEIVFVGPDPDNDFEQMEGVITPDFWEGFAPELPHGIIYNIVYGQRHSDAHEKIFVLRGIANGMEIQMNFHRDHQSWKLTKLSE